MKIIQTFLLMFFLFPVAGLFQLAPTYGVEGGTCQVAPENGTITSDQCDKAAGYSCQTKLTQAEIPYFTGKCMPKIINGSCSLNSDCGTTQCCNSNVCGSCPSGGGSSSHGGGFGSPNLCKDGTHGVDTDFGCIPSDPAKLANVIFGLVLGFAGGLAVLFIIIGGFKIATSAGNPDSLEDGRHTITAAISGLVFILLATTILGIIGVDILNLGLFSRNGGSVIISH